MNMKKTFAGAMAGALAVSAMATSANAAKLEPGDYTYDLTKDAEFYATVQFTFDGDYMVNDLIYAMKDGSPDKYLGLNFSSKVRAGDGEKNFFDISGMKTLDVTVTGTTGTKAQTLSYNTTWNDVNFYNWNLFNYKANAFDGQFKMPVADKGVANNAQTLFLDKYNTVKEALAVKKTDGTKKYPDIWNGTSYVSDSNDALDYAMFDKIVITAKIPATRDFTLDVLNGTSGYKTNVTASIQGLNDLAIYEVDADTTDLTAAKTALDAAKAVVTELNTAKAALAVYDAAVAATIDPATGSAYLAPTATVLESITVDASGGGPATFDTIAGTKLLTTKVGSDTFVQNPNTGVLVKCDAAGITAIETWNNKVETYLTAKAAYDAKMDKPATALTAYNTLVNGKSYESYTTIAEYDAALVTANADVDTKQAAYDVLDAADDNYVGVKVQAPTTTPRTLDDYSKINLPVVAAETLFTKFEKNRIGVKTGIKLDDDGLFKTLVGDIGTWKPDAVRQIADAIADYEGVTLTFTAKDNFDDAAYRAWAKAYVDYGHNTAGYYSTLYPNWVSTDSVKDDYSTWGVSMFTGAIVLNRDFSKQFSESTLVDWGTNTMTFDWDELTEGRFYDASIVLHSIELMTTQNAEWVAVTVSIPEQTAEDVNSSEGAEDDSTEIDDTPVVEEIITEAPVTEAPVTEAVTEAAPAAPVTNPTTGNAPVALAVIPVALAAAAIVAKKRG